MADPVLIEGGMLTTIVRMTEAILIGSRGEMVRNSLGLFQSLLIIDIGLASVWWSVTRENYIPIFLKKFFIVYFHFWFITDFTRILNWALGGFLEIAQINSPFDRNIEVLVMDPSALLGRVYDIFAPTIGELLIMTVSGRWGGLIMSLVALFFGLRAGIRLAIDTFVLVMEYLIASSVALMLIPFMVFSKTAFLGNKIYEMALTYGIRLMVLGIVLGLLDPIFIAMKATAAGQTTFYALVFQTVTMIAISSLVVSTQKMAVGLLTGSPNLDHGAAAAGQSFLANSVSSPVTMGAMALTGGASMVANAGASTMAASSASRAAGGGPLKNAFMGGLGGLTSVAKDIGANTLSASGMSGAQRREVANSMMDRFNNAPFTKSQFGGSPQKNNKDPKGEGTGSKNNKGDKNTDQSKNNSDKTQE